MTLLEFAAKQARETWTPNHDLRKAAIAAETARLLHDLIGRYHGYTPTSWFGTTNAQRHVLVEAVNDFLNDMAPPRCAMCGEFLPDLHHEPYCGKPECSILGEGA